MKRRNKKLRSAASDQSVCVSLTQSERVAALRFAVRLRVVVRSYSRSTFRHKCKLQL